MRLLNGIIRVEGVGLHSGKECVLTIEPCDAPEVMMNGVPLRKLRTRGTNRGSDYIFPSGEEVRTCEHVLSALYGTGIYSGVRVNVDGGEMPAIDGCSSFLIGEILSNSCEDGHEVPSLEVREPIIVSNDDRTRFVAAFPDTCFHVTYTVEYEKVGAEVYDYAHTTANYVNDIAGARTFALERDIEYLRSHGMALGGTLDNAIVIGDTIHAKGGLRWPNEFVRHKVLDLIGDLASLGRPLNAHIIAMRAGHELHLKLTERLKEETGIARD